MNPFQPPAHPEAPLPSRERRSGWLGRAHLMTFVALWGVFGVLTFLAVFNGLDNAAQRPTRVALTTVASLFGPMTGAIAREMQGCCLEFSLWLLPWCLPPLLLAVFVQWLWRPKNAAARGFRVLIWSLGWVIWFGGGIVSFGHALS